MEVFTFLIIVALALFIGLKYKKINISRQPNEPNTDVWSPKQNQPKESQILDTVRFKYQEYDGEITERTVDIITGKTGKEFKGYCHLIKDIRYFNFNRIQGFEVTHMTTGEVTSPMAWKYKLQGTKVAEEEMIDEHSRIENEKKHIEASQSWLSLTNPAPKVEFDNKRFALAGYFSSGNRDDSEAKVEKKGGMIQKTPNGKTDYIVVNPDRGVNGSFKKAILSLLDRGIQPAIISEDHWLSSINNS